MITGRRFHVTTEIGENTLIVTTTQIDETMLDDILDRRREIRVVGEFDHELRVTGMRIDRFIGDWSEQHDDSVYFIELEGTKPGYGYNARVRELTAAVNCPALVPMLNQVGATALRCFRTGAFEKRRSRPPRATSRPPGSVSPLN